MPVKLFRHVIISASIVISAAAYAHDVKTDTAAEQNITVAPKTDLSAMQTAIFVRNNGGRELNNEINTFEDMLSARLTEKGFSIMSWQDIIQKFSEANEPDEKIYDYAKSFMASSTQTPVNNSMTAFTETSKSTLPQNSLTAQTKEGGVAKSSSLRIAQMLGAKYMIAASMGRLGHEKRVFKGEGTIYKTGNEADIYTLPLTIRVMDGTTGASIYGDVYIANTTIYQNQSIQITMDNIVDKLLNSGTDSLAVNIAAKLDSIKSATPQTAPEVEFFLDCNVPGASAELDGAVIGTPPSSFKAKPGLHQLRISREYFQPWEQTVNIYAGQKLTVSLEFTTDGQAKFKDLAAFKQAEELNKATTYAEIDIAKQQSQADADVKEKVSSGEETFLKNSYIRSDGFAEQLTEIIHGN